MKSVFSIFLFFSTLLLTAQGFHNLGGIRMHNNANIGFHTNILNNGSFVTNENTLVGFYGDNPLQVQGSLSPTLYDMEVFLPNNLLLNIPLNVSNNLNFVEGNISSPLNNQVVYLNFLENCRDGSWSDMYLMTNFSFRCDPFNVTEFCSLYYLISLKREKPGNGICNANYWEPR